MNRGSPSVVLINPPYLKYYGPVELAAGIVQPIGLASIASLAEKEGINVKLFDANAERCTINDLAKFLERYQYDIVGVPSFTMSLTSSIDVLRVAKKINPSCLTVIGGPHATATPVELLEEYSEVDVVVRGEGEYTFVDLVRNVESKLRFKEVPGITYRHDGLIYNNPSRPLIEELDALPFPAYHMLPMKKYRPGIHHVAGCGRKLTPFCAIFTSRGCPFECTFCASHLIWSRRVRYRSASNILAEIDLLVNEYKIRYLDIDDDTFTINRERCLEVLSGLIERNYDLHFTCLTRVDCIDTELISKMRAAGCSLIRFGVESGAQEILNNMKKGISIDEIRKAFRLTREVGVSTHASFMLGYPNETYKTFRKTVDLAKQIKPDLAQFFITVPFPGTALLDTVRKKDLLIEREWKYWGQMTDKSVLRTETLSAEELISLRKEAYRQFYLRPNFIVRRLTQIKTIEEASFYLRGLLSVIRLIFE